MHTADMAAHLQAWGHAGLLICRRSFAVVDCSALTRRRRPKQHQRSPCACTEGNTMTASTSISVQAARSSRNMMSLAPPSRCARCPAPDVISVLVGRRAWSGSVSAGLSAVLGIEAGGPGALPLSPRRTSHSWAALRACLQHVIQAHALVHPASCCPCVLHTRRRRLAPYTASTVTLWSPHHIAPGLPPATRT